MQQLENFLLKLSKPLMQFLNALWTFIVRVDKWYKEKSTVTKCSIRWGVICATLIGLNVNERVKSDARDNSNSIRNTLLLNNEKRAHEECEKWRIERLEMEIQKLEKYDKRIDENNEKFQIIKK